MNEITATRSWPPKPMTPGKHNRPPPEAVIAAEAGIQSFRRPGVALHAGY